jgi:membrane protein
MQWLKESRKVLEGTLVSALEDGIMARGAALSYYVFLSLGPLLALLVGVLQLVASDAAQRQTVVDAIQQFVGAQAADTVEMVMRRANPPDFLSPASILTIAALLYGATGAFSNVRGSLNAIWDIEEEAQSYGERILNFLRTRWKAFLMIVLTGLILGLSFLISFVGNLLSPLLTQSVPFGAPLVWSLDIAISVVMVGLLFGATLRTLPGVRIEWSSLWIGAFGTGALFMVTRTLIVRIIASTGVSDYYGAGASLVAFLVWIYLSTQIFFLGAEFTKVWSRRR